MFPLLSILLTGCLCLFYHVRHLLSARHIEMDCHFIYDKIQDGSVARKYVPSDEQLVDVFKQLEKEAFSTMKRKLGVLDIHSPT